MNPAPWGILRLAASTLGSTFHGECYYSKMSDVDELMVRFESASPSRR